MAFVYQEIKESLTYLLICCMCTVHSQATSRST